MFPFYNLWWTRLKNILKTYVVILRRKYFRQINMVDLELPNDKWRVCTMRVLYLEERGWGHTVSKLGKVREDLRHLTNGQVSSWHESWLERMGGPSGATTLGPARRWIGCWQQKLRRPLKMNELDRLHHWQGEPHWESSRRSLATGTNRVAGQKKCEDFPG